MAKAIGIDIGTRACKVAVVDGGPKGARLVRFAEAEYAVGAGGAPTAEDVIAGIRKALAEAKGPKGAASFAMPAEQLVLREITVPFEQEEQVRKVLKFEFEPHLHAGAIEDYVIDFVRTGTANLGPGKTGSRVLVLAAAKEGIRARLEQLKAAAVDPLHIDVDIAALFNVAKHSGALDAHPNCLVIDIGARTTKALAIREGKLRVARSIRIGARGARKELENRLDGDGAAAQRALDASSLPEGLNAPADGPSTVEIVASVSEIEAAVARAVQDDFLGRMLRETARTLPASGDGAPITCVYLTGGGAMHRRARDRIASHFGVEVKDLPVLAHLPNSMAPSEQTTAAAVGAVAIGSALKVIGIDEGKIDLRQDEFRFSRTFDRVKFAAAACVTLLFFCVFLYALTAFVGMQKAERELKALRAEIVAKVDDDVFKKYEALKLPDARSAPQASGDNATAIKQTKEYLTSVRTHLQNELGLATEVPPIRSCLETWMTVSKALADLRTKIPYLLVKSEKYVQGQGDVTLVVNEATDAETVKLKLLEMKSIVKSAETRPPKRSKDGTKAEVTIHLEFVEKTNEENEGGEEAAR